MWFFRGAKLDRNSNTKRGKYFELINLLIRDAYITYKWKKIVKEGLRLLRSFDSFFQRMMFLQGKHNALKLKISFAENKYTRELSQFLSTKRCRYIREVKIRKKCHVQTYVAGSIVKGKDLQQEKRSYETRTEVIVILLRL